MNNTIINIDKYKIVTMVYDSFTELILYIHWCLFTFQDSELTNDHDPQKKKKKMPMECVNWSEHNYCLLVHVRSKLTTQKITIKQRPTKLFIYKSYFPSWHTLNILPPPHTQRRPTTRVIQVQQNEHINTLLLHQTISHNLTVP